MQVEHLDGLELLVGVPGVARVRPLLPKRDRAARGVRRKTPQKKGPEFESRPSRSQRTHHLDPRADHDGRVHLHLKQSQSAGSTSAVPPHAPATRGPSEHSTRPCMYAPASRASRPG